MTGASTTSALCSIRHPPIKVVHSRKPSQAWAEAESKALVSGPTGSLLESGPGSLCRAPKISPPDDSDEFAEAVFVTEGDGFSTSDQLVGQAREIIAQAFRRLRDPSQGSPRRKSVPVGGKSATG